MSMSSYLLMIFQLFSVDQSQNKSAVDLNHDLDLIKRWAHD